MTPDQILEEMAFDLGRLGTYPEINEWWKRFHEVCKRPDLHDPAVQALVQAWIATEKMVYERATCKRSELW